MTDPTRHGLATATKLKLQPVEVAEPDVDSYEPLVVKFRLPAGAPRHRVVGLLCASDAPGRVFDFYVEPWGKHPRGPNQVQECGVPATAFAEDDEWTVSLRDRLEIGGGVGPGGLPTVVVVFDYAAFSTSRPSAPSYGSSPSNSARVHDRPHPS